MRDDLHRVPVPLYNGGVLPTDNPLHHDQPEGHFTCSANVTVPGEETTPVRAEVDAALHGNQQGTVHGGFLVELADTTIGTAHSTFMGTGESFTSQIGEIPLRHWMRNRRMRTQSTHDLSRMKSD
ncbi:MULTISPECIES: hypothetical protein [unclassified Streptomyces]|uniref:hypothetical protein n=1 Tax=unclassified Streptomyces TaxID=2593676 RepID=UPI0033921045